MRFSYCPHCGEKLVRKEIGDEGKIPYCEKCQVPLWDMFTTSIIAAVVNECGEVALIRQNYVSETSYVCVAGIMKIGESAEETVAREVKEEIGQDVDAVEFIGSYPYEKKEMLMLGYKATVKKRDFKLSGEVDSAEWVKYEKALSLLREGSIAWQLVRKVIGPQAGERRIIEIPRFYGSLPGMLKKFDRYGRQDRFVGGTLEELRQWQETSRETLKELIGWRRMEDCELLPRVEERVTLEDGIVREKVVIQVEPDTWMPMYILIPPEKKWSESGKPECFLCLPGHQGGGKYSVAGCYEIPAIKEKIDFFHYDYGMQMARRGYVAVCPDCRGFGERRDEALRNQEDEKAFLASTCFHLSHMAEALGETVIGMCAWDTSRLIDYVYERGEWSTESLGVMGFSGGGMQTLWISALDTRVKRAIISGYLYGYKDSLLILNGNCNCNYVPHLWEHFDMGDIASLIAPRPLAVQSCREDHLNGPRGLANVREQMDTVRQAYRLYGSERYPFHDVRDGEHCWHGEILDELHRIGFGVESEQRRGEG